MGQAVPTLLTSKLRCIRALIQIQHNKLILKHFLNTNVMDNMHGQVYV